MSVDQERVRAETDNNDESVLQAPHYEHDADQELEQPADLLIDIQPEDWAEDMEEGTLVEEDPDPEGEKEGNPEGEDSDWDMDVTSYEYENVNKRAERRHLEVTFNVLKPTENQKRVGVSDTREKEAKKKEKRKKKQLEAKTENLEEHEHPWEAHLWVNNAKLGERDKMGFQIFLGNYKTEKQAQDAHDTAAIFFKKTGAHRKDYILNFPASEQAEHMAKFHDWWVRDFTWWWRRHSDSFTRSKVKLKGVTQITSRGKNWFEAKISYTDTSKNEWNLGRFNTKEEAGRAYDLALLYCHRYEGTAEIINHVITNHQPSQYTNAEIREAGRKLIPKPLPKRKVRELTSEMHKKRRRLDR